MAEYSLLENMKFLRLVKTLNVPVATVWGSLDLLWRNAYITDSPCYLREDIEIAAQWPGEDGVFADALIKGRWLDEQEDGTWRIHQYEEHAIPSVKARWRMRNERSSKKNTDKNVPNNSEHVGNNSEHKETVQQNSYKIRKDKIRKDKIREDKKEKSASPSLDAAHDSPLSPLSTPHRFDAAAIFNSMHLPIAGGGRIELNDDLHTYAANFPDLDIHHEVKAAQAYLYKNPTKMRSAPATKKFFSSWLERSATP